MWEKPLRDRKVAKPTRDGRRKRRSTPSRRKTLGCWVAWPSGWDGMKRERGWPGKRTVSQSGGGNALEGNPMGATGDISNVSRYS
jgi:hypothetical protein